MRERAFRRAVVDMLQPIGAFAVENMACDGTPDVCTAVGWIELKVGTWPAHASTRVRVDLRVAQGIWMRRWIRHGGRVWTMTLVNQSVMSAKRDDSAWFLHNAEWSHEHLGNVTEEQMKEHALAWWSGKPVAEELLQAILKGMRA